MAGASRFLQSLLDGPRGLLRGLARRRAERRIGALQAVGHQDAAAEASIRSFGPELVGYLRAVVGDEQQAADAFGACAQQIWLRRDRPGHLSPYLWCYRLAWQAARGACERAGGAATRAEPPPWVTAAMASGEELPLGDLLARLTPVPGPGGGAPRAQVTAYERSLLVLRIGRRLAWEEIAWVLGEEGEKPDAAAVERRFAQLREAEVKPERPS